ncbi:hypothetical protein [Hansschlegelia plantiphila]|uniref:DUF1795 domain-containing protein n=1 Tax=Hansschlegelia plantiphila TaxID=374655 RepID=A0A9W6IYB4_9HYPH|nr:hypothetical protein [Hansschlegelia plantiphila]GLK67381.1 hypothetical protein GCM10008179_10190 [Hansschlegelia plantiphila]
MARISRMSVLALAAALSAATPAFAQAPAPAGAAPAAPGADGPPPPGSPEMIVGPDSAFTLTPDGKDWTKFQTVRQIGVKCSDKACGGDRVFCLIQTRAAADAKPGEAVSESSANAFGQHLIESSPKEMKASYVEPFSEKRIGANLGRWAEMKAEGEPGSIRFSLFLVQVKAREVAFNCVAPADKWAVHEPKIEAVLAALQVTR